MTCTRSRRETAAAAATVATALLLTTVLVTGCSHAPPAVPFTHEWPARPGDYREVTRAWTRSGSFHSGPSSSQDHLIEQTLEVTATFESPAWRAAYVKFMARQNQLSQPAIEALRAKQQAAAAKAYEVALRVATYDQRANDLQKGKRSIWRVALVDDAGHEIVASEIQRDRRPRSEIEAEFPGLGDFQQPYVARFPRTVDLLRPGAQRFTLKVTSAQGGVDLVWRAAR